MPRRFRQHDMRRVTDLAGIWDFAFLGDAGPEDVDPRAIEFADRMAVPGCFDATPAYAGRRGLAAYRTRAVLSDAAAHRLVLDGVHHWCRIFVDGLALRDHVGGFTRFAADIDGHAAGPAEIVILVDNRFDAARCPLHLEYFDWYHYGGIARGAQLHRLGPLWIDSVRIVTEDLAARQLRLTIDYASTGAPERAPLRIECDGREAARETVALPAGAGRIERTIELAGAALWSPQEPNLHEVRVVLGDDDLRERIGIRQVRAAGREILINDRPVRLRGFCRHEAHPQFGHALPEQVIVGDVQLLRDLGCNFVRGSHYPQDSRFLDLCDETGLCVWSESIGWWQSTEHLTDEGFMSAQLAHVDEMVAAAANHPSVILWGVLNESRSDDPACRPAYQRLLGRLRELDPSRPVTYATCHPFDDVCYDLADVISVNAYPGWYGGGIESIPAAMEKIFAHLDEAGQGDKPLIVSEIGAGAIYGWRDAHETRWSEQYQARLLEAAIRFLLVDSDRSCGLSLWQFCDCRTSELCERVLKRPRAFNNKGVLDEYRRAKLAYETVERLFRGLRG